MSRCTPKWSCFSASVGLVIVMAATIGCGLTSASGPIASVGDDSADNTKARDSEGAPPSNMAHTNWPVYRGDAQARGVAPCDLPERPELLWQFRVEGGAFEATPVILDGTIYIGDLDGKLYALDLATGDKRWEFTAPSGIGFNASPAVRDGLVYVGDLFGQFYAVHADTGKLAWQYQAQAEINSSANFHGDHVLFGSQDATLYCLKAKTDKPEGELVWSYQIGDQIRCSPTIVEGRVFLAGCDGVLHIVDVTKGEKIDGVDIEGPTGATPAALGDRVFFGTESGTFFAVDWKEARIAWRFDDQASAMPIRGAPAVTDSLVIVGGQNRRVYAFDPEKGGDPVWEFATKQRVDGSPVVVGQRVFVGSADGRLYALNLMDGKESWQFEGEGGFLGSPAVADNRLVIATDRGVVYCLGEKRN